MSHIRVNPHSVTNVYGPQAQGSFDAINTELNGLVDSCVNVFYRGENSVRFKQAVGNLATEFSADTHRRMMGIAASVQAATQAISSSLGGRAITLEVRSGTVAPAKPVVQDEVEVKLDALTDLTGTVGTHFQKIRQFFDDHLTALRNTDWEGDAKVSALQSVGRQTTDAQASCDEAMRQINERINEQITATAQADRTKV